MGKANFIHSGGIGRARILVEPRASLVETGWRGGVAGG